MRERGLYEHVMAGVPDELRPEPRVRASAGVVPWRRTGNDLEVFWVERSRDLAFMGGFHAFPGGGLKRSDKDIVLEGTPEGVDGGPVAAGMPASVLEGVELEPLLVPGLIECLVRELFEETGLLLARRIDHGTLAADRARLREEQVSFGELARQRAWQLDASGLVYAGRWLTPPLGPVRFDNRFFLLEWPETREAQPEVCGSELVSGEWVRPEEALDRWRHGRVMTAPPILHILEALAEDGPEAAIERLREPLERNLGPYRSIEFRPGVLMFPLPTLTLPPATHTNAYVLGLEEAVLVDPGTPFQEHQQGLIEAILALAGKGRRVGAVWLTHHHPDHVGAVEFVRRELGLPVLAHRLSAVRLAAQGIEVDGELRHGERIELAGAQSFPVRVVHTPGHASGHLAFLDETYGSLLAGDVTAGIGTIVIDPPEGDMDAYLRSLASLQELNARTLFPAHGPPTIQVADKLDEYVRHRLWREEKILSLWVSGHSGDELLAAAYDDVPAIARPLARRQLVAHLVRLERLGKVPAGTSAQHDVS